MQRRGLVKHRPNDHRFGGQSHAKRSEKRLLGIVLGARTTRDASEGIKQSPTITATVITVRPCGVSGAMSPKPTVDKAMVLK